MATYQVKPGVVFGVRGLVWPATVELTEVEAAGFLDLVELVETASAGQPAPADDSEPQPALKQARRAKQQAIG